jgi:hypothetical protein
VNTLASLEQAELFSLAGDHAGARRILEAIPPTESPGLSLGQAVFSAQLGAGEAAIADGAWEDAAVVCGLALEQRPLDGAAAACVAGAQPPAPEPTAIPTATSPPPTSTPIPPTPRPAPPTAVPAPARQDPEPAPVVAPTPTRLPPPPVREPEATPTRLPPPF